MTRRIDGKASKVFSTREGEDLRIPIEEAWKRLHQRYARVLGIKKGDALTAMIDEASDKLSKEA